jgi:hypothetical protein
MTDRPTDQAPELYNDEQEDELEQAQTVADEARQARTEGSPLDSI